MIDTNKVNKPKSILITLVILLVINYIYFPNQIFVQVYSLCMLVLIYLYFDKSKFLYYSMLLFAFIDYSLVFPIGSRITIYYSIVCIAIYVFLNVKSIFEYLKRMLTLKFYCKLDKYTIFLLVFIVYALVGIIFANNIKLSIQSLVTYVYMISLMLIIIRENKTTDSIYDTIKFLFVIFSSIVLIGTLEVLGFKFGIQTNYVKAGFDVQNISYFKHIPIVFFFNQNNYAVYVVLSSIIVILLSYENKIVNHKFIFLSTYVLSIINLIYTTSRICWVSIFLGIFMLLFLTISKKNKSLRNVGIKYLVLTAFIFGICYIMPQSTVYYGKLANTKIIKIFNFTKNNAEVVKSENLPSLGGKGSDNERYTLLKDVLTGVFKKKHYLGFGMGNTLDYIKKVNNTNGVYNPHSMWFEFLGDYGILMLVYYVIIYILLIKNLIYNNSTISVTLGILCFLFIFLAFSPSTVTGFAPFWILLGVSVSQAKLNSADKY